MTQAMDSERPTLARLALSPANWPLLLGLGLLRGLVLLPYRMQLALGRGAGWLLYRLIPKRRHVAAVNLRICFPDLSDSEQARLLKKHFASLGIAIFELALAWWASDRRIDALTRFNGLQNLTEPLARGEGVVLLSAHLPGIELTGRKVMFSLSEIASVYRSSKNPLLNEILLRARMRAATDLIRKDDIRQMIRILRKGGVPVWYAPDQSYRQKYHELVPFFGEPAMTNAALTPITRITKAKVVPYLPRRLENGRGYQVDILPALENFPSDDPAADASRINELFEAHIRQMPDQYYWVHRRFKDRPPPFKDPYRASE